MTIHTQEQNDAIVAELKGQFAPHVQLSMPILQGLQITIGEKSHSVDKRIRDVQALGEIVNAYNCALYEGQLLGKRNAQLEALKAQGVTVRKDGTLVFGNE